MTMVNLYKKSLKALGVLAIGIALMSCGGGGGGGGDSFSPSTSGGDFSLTEPGVNIAPIIVDAGPPAAKGNINLPFVSVTICTPGTSDCRTIDHILLDTGSYGLRIIEPGVINASLSLPAVTSESGKPLAECAQFVSGFTWGSVNYADVKIAGRTARSAPIEIISNSNRAYSNIPDACSGTGANMGTVADLGANGILGVGLFKEDCGPACASSTRPGFYYECSSEGICTGARVPLGKQVVNPVALFPEDNNGVLVEFPGVPRGGVPFLAGRLVLGVGTQANNQVAGKTVYRADGYGNFRTTYKGRTYGSSFIDSGSNGVFFPDSSIPGCTYSSGFYCPSSPLTLSAVNAAYDGSAYGSVNFTIENVDRLGYSINAASVGGGISSLDGISGFDWGLPFFFGRSVYVAIENSQTPSGRGPFWAY